MNKLIFHRCTTFLAQLLVVFVLLLGNTSSLAVDYDDPVWSDLESGNGKYKPAAKPRVTPCLAVKVAVLMLTLEAVHYHLACQPDPWLVNPEQLSLRGQEPAPPASAPCEDYAAFSLAVKSITPQEYSEQLAECALASTPELSLLLADIVGGLKNDDQLFADYPHEMLWEQLMQAASLSNRTTLQTALGFCYLHGKGVDKDEKKAVELFQQGAEQGLASAQFWLGYCYLFKHGDLNNAHQAYQLFLQSSKSGHAYGKLGLSYCYMYGRGIRRKERLAVELIKEAAELGSALGQYNLAIVIRDETGGEKKDRQRMLELLQQAAANGLAKAQHELNKHHSEL